MTTTALQQYPRFFAMGDIHGEYDKLITVMDLITKEAGYDPAKDEFVQLGDKPDRGPKTFEVIEYFREMSLKHPGRFIMIHGNHEDMMVTAAREMRKDHSYWIPCNGGDKTLESYSEHTKLYGKGSLYNSLNMTGHLNFIRDEYLFYETEDYFFSHAPIPKERYRNLTRGRDFRADKNTLLWSYPGDWGVEESEWIDPVLIPKEDNNGCKICVSGHIHGMYETKEWYIDPRTSEGYFLSKTVVPGVRCYSNAVLLDTGAGCDPMGYLSCLELPAMKVYTSRGEIYQI